MQRDELEQLMISVLYNEAAPVERERLLQWLGNHPEERREYEKLGMVIRNLNRVPEPVVAQSTNHVALPTVQHKKSKWMKYAVMAMAACLLAMFCITQGLLIQVGSFRIAFGPAAGDEALQRLVMQEWKNHVQPSLAEIALRVEEADRRWDLMADKQTAFEQSFEQSLQNLTLLRSQDLEMQQRSFLQLASRLDRSLDDRLGEYMLISQLPPDAYPTPNSGDGVNTKSE